MSLAKISFYILMILIFTVIQEVWYLCIIIGVIRSRGENKGILALAGMYKNTYVSQIAFKNMGDRAKKSDVIDAVYINEGFLKHVLWIAVGINVIIGGLMIKFYFLIRDSSILVNKNRELQNIFWISITTMTLSFLLAVIYLFKGYPGYINRRTDWFLLGSLASIIILQIPNIIMMILLFRQLSNVLKTCDPIMNFTEDSP